nr:Chain A, Large T antigen [Betapolyomavirus macacae]4RXH_C Chain C, Large T antigen [Betapolyomavirus macacae]
PPKKKRKV